MGAHVFPQSSDLHFGLGTDHRLLVSHEEEKKSVARAHEIRDEKMLAEFLRKKKKSLPKTADEVIARHLEAVGGSENLQEIKTLIITYSALDSIDQETFITRYLML